MGYWCGLLSRLNRVLVKDKVRLKIKKERVILQQAAIKRRGGQQLVIARLQCFDNLGSNACFDRDLRDRQPLFLACRTQLIAQTCHL